MIRQAVYTERSTTPTLVLVEGDSDAAALRALAGLLGCDLDAHRIHIQSAHGVTNFSHLLVEFLHTHPGARFCGMYDTADERHVRRALAYAGSPIDADGCLESFGFFACVADLEDELIRALGVEAVERVLEAQGELTSFRRFQAMPPHRRTPVHHQLRRFLGTRATRKIRSAQRLVETLDPARLPRPLVQLMSKLLEAPAPLAGAMTPNASLAPTSYARLSSNVGRTLSWKQLVGLKVRNANGRDVFRR